MVVHLACAVVFWLWEHILLICLYPGRAVFSLYSQIATFVKILRYSKSDKKVVVIGGGFSGSKVAKNLQSLFNVTLVDTKDFFEFTPSVLRTLVQPGKVRTIQVFHKEYLDKAKVFTGKALTIRQEDRALECQEKLSGSVVTFPYDYLVICSGSSYHEPFKNPNVIITTRANDLASCAYRVEEANSILIIGGGYVGVELAAEIITKFPTKKVTIVHNSERLLIRSPKRASEYAQQFFEKRNTTLLLNETVLLDESDASYSKAGKAATFKTKSGKTIVADIAFMCTGMWPNSSYLADTKSDIVDDRGFVKAKSTLQTELGANIFVCGDVADIKEEKLAQGAQNTAAVAIDNILRMEQKQPLANYTSASMPIVISLGKYDAIFTWKDFCVTGFVPSLIKEAVQWKVLVCY